MDDSSDRGREDRAGRVFKEEEFDRLPGDQKISDASFPEQIGKTPLQEKMFAYSPSTISKSKRRRCIIAFQKSPKGWGKRISAV